MNNIAQLQESQPDVRKLLSELSIPAQQIRVWNDLFHEVNKAFPLVAGDRGAIKRANGRKECLPRYPELFRWREEFRSAAFERASEDQTQVLLGIMCDAFRAKDTPSLPVYLVVLGYMADDYDGDDFDGGAEQRIFGLKGFSSQAVVYALKAAMKRKFLPSANEFLADLTHARWRFLKAYEAMEKMENLRSNAEDITGEFDEDYPMPMSSASGLDDG